MSGAIIGAFVYKLLDFGLTRFIGQSAYFILGAIYVIFVLFIPYGIVGTWNLRKLGMKQAWKLGWQKITGIISGKSVE